MCPRAHYASRGDLGARAQETQTIFKGWKRAALAGPCAP